MDTVDRLDYDAFMARFGGVFEQSPWVVQLALIRAHPDLAVNVSLTPESEREQSAAGLDSLSPEQYERISWLTTAYRAHFGFPFVVCAREHTPDTIIAAAERRTESGPEEEEQTALSEIAKIARLRLADLVAQ